MSELKIETKDSHIRRIIVSKGLTPAEADSININRLYIDMTSHARLHLEQADFTPLNEVIRHIKDPDPITLERVLAVELVGTKDE